jgi:SAM-dependent methyltransferase
MKPFTAYQKTVNAEVLRSLEGLDAARANLERDQLRADVERLAQERRGERESIAVRASFDAVTERVDDSGSRLDELLLSRNTIAERLDDLTRRLDVVEDGSRAIPYMDGSPFELLRDPVAGVVQGYSGRPTNGATGDGYRSFEDIFRGSEDFIRDRQRRYVDIIGEHEPVLDFGCGRGEFLDLLRDRGLIYQGVDTDPGMVTRCQEKGHANVVLDDGLDLLAQLDDASLGTIFSAQVIEHLDYDAIVRFFELARAKLKPGGLLIAETVNPHSARALKAFWVDLTHHQPIFPEVALALARSVGFSSAYVFHPNGTGDVDRDRFVEGEFALVATPGEQIASSHARPTQAGASN